jgi:hypothetical protein
MRQPCSDSTGLSPTFVSPNYRFDPRSGLFWLAPARIVWLSAASTSCYLKITKAALVLADILGAIIPRKVEEFYISENKTDAN